MKTKNAVNHIWPAVAVLLVMSILYGCRDREENKYGQAISDYTLTKIDAILKDPAGFEGKTVTLRGSIVRECPTGCWFELKENGAIIYVDLNPSGFAIPQKVGKEVIARGKISLRAAQPMLAGTGVEIK